MDQEIEYIWVLMARKLSGEASADELDELEQLLVQNPQETYSLEIMQDIWKNRPAINPLSSECGYKELVFRMQHLGIDSEKFSTGDHVISRSEEAGLKKSSSKKYRVISLLMLTGLVILSLLLFSKKEDQKKVLADTATNEIVTKNGSKTNLVLPDGTNVFLNSGSKITYAKNYGIHCREVSLIGEAYFDVVKNTAMPFIIHTSKINVRVLGTAFNVRCYPDEKNTVTSLIRGSLEVSFKDGREKIMLTPNEKLVVNNETIPQNFSPVKSKNNISAKNVYELSHVAVMPKDNSIVETSWVYNRLVFNSETFEDIAHKMEKWYGNPISFKDENLKSKKFTGVFEKETIYEALDAIKMTTEFLYKEKDGQIILSK
jgi:transmembrane sensor